MGFGVKAHLDVSGGVTDGSPGRLHSSVSAGRPDG